MVFIDTSGFLAVLDEDDEFQPTAKKIWHDLIASDENLITSNYVLVETIALAQHRLGLESVRAFQEDIYPLLQVIWIDNITHEKAISSVLNFSRRKLSLVDCTSFEIMQRMGIKKVFLF